MLNQLLDLLRAGGTQQITDLARALDTTPGLVEVMLEDLCRKGYLKQVSGECGKDCGSCSMAGLCAVGAPGQLWTFVSDVSEE
jgi:hypothetical protein